MPGFISRLLSGSNQESADLGQMSRPGGGVTLEGETAKLLGYGSRASSECIPSESSPTHDAYLRRANSISEDAIERLDIVLDPTSDKLMTEKHVLLSTPGGGSAYGEDLEAAEEMASLSRVEIALVWIYDNGLLLTYIIMYVSISIGLTIFNKWLLAVHNFCYPILIVTVDFVACFFFALGVCFMNWDKISMSSFSPTRVTFMQYLTTFVHVGISTGADTLLTQLTLITTSITLCEVIKSGLPVLVLIFGVFRPGGEITISKALVVATISLGICLTTMGGLGGGSHIWGIVAAVGSTVCGAARLVFMEGLLSEDNGNGGKIDSFLAIAYILPSAIITLVIMLIPIEGSDIADSAFFFNGPGGGMDLSITFLSGHLVLGIVLRIMEVCVISHSSALTTCVVGVLKMVVTVGMSIVIFGDPVSFVNGLGVAIAIFGVAIYNYREFASYEHRSRKTSCRSSFGDYGALRRDSDARADKDFNESYESEGDMLESANLYY